METMFRSGFSRKAASKQVFHGDAMPEQTPTKDLDSGRMDEAAIQFLLDATGKSKHEVISYLSPGRFSCLRDRFN